jgi:hypothetical protein
MEVVHHLHARIDSIQGNIWHIFASTYHIIFTEKTPYSARPALNIFAAAEQKSLGAVDIRSLCLKVVSRNGAR